MSHLATNNRMALEVVNMNVRYDFNPVISDFSVSVPIQTFTAIIGPNGAGKSSFLKSLIDLVPRDSGEVFFFGSPAKHQLTNIAYVAQRQEIDWDFPITVREVVEMGRLGYLKWWQRLKKQDHLIVDQALERTGIVELQKRQISELSGGQQQRMFIARALAQQAAFYLMDEPFAGVDITTEKVLATLFKELVADGATIIAVHHDVVSARTYFDRAILLNQYLVADGPIDKILTDENLRKTYSSQDPVQQAYNVAVKRNALWPKHE